ncbi:MAG TPA: heme-binding protein, partial [Thauera phenylacetica]|nr:heme-binding protein [Thauera phenylacetica]
MKVAVPQATISWEAAHAAVAAAVAKAEALGVRINVGVADASGNLVAFLRMPGAFPQSIAIAIDKAYTAGGFGFPTGKWM